METGFGGLVSLLGLLSLGEWAAHAHQLGALVGTSVSASWCQQWKRRGPWFACMKPFLLITKINICTFSAIAKISNSYVS